jgi:hypothetical protein
MKKSNKHYTYYGTYYCDCTHKEAMEHQGEEENHVLTTMENNHHSRKTKEKINQEDVDKNYGNS